MNLFLVHESFLSSLDRPGAQKLQTKHFYSLQSLEGMHAAYKDLKEHVDCRFCSNAEKE